MPIAPRSDEDHPQLLALRRLAAALFAPDASRAEECFARTWMHWRQGPAHPGSPTLAWTRHPAAMTVRLPIAGDDLKSTWQASLALPVDEQWHALQTPLGQWTSALAEIRALLESEPASAGAILKSLSAFTARHWAGWYDAALAAFAASANSVQREIVDVIGRHASSVALAYAAEPLAEWYAPNAARRRVYPLLDALAYRAQGLAFDEAIATRAAADAWWSAAHTAIERVRTRQAEQGPLERLDTVWQPLLDRLDGLIATFPARLAHVTVDGTAAAVEALSAGQAIVAALDEMAALVAAERQRLDHAVDHVLRRAHA